MYQVTFIGSGDTWDEDFPGSRVRWVSGQTREVHDSLVQRFRNNPASWSVSGGDDSSPALVSKTLSGKVGSFVGEKIVPSGYVSLSQKPIKVGMNVFPGWSTPGGGPSPSAPWSVIPKSREPLSVLYDEADQKVIDTQIQWMIDHGIDYVMIDWFFDTTTHSSSSSTLVPALDHWINGFMASEVVGKPKFMVMWAASTNASYLTNAGFANAISHFAQNYFTHPDYLFIDGKPAVGFLDIQTSFANVSPSGIDGIQSLFVQAKSDVSTLGFDGLYVVAGCSSSAEYWQGKVNHAAFDAVFPLNPGQRCKVGDGAFSTKSATTYLDILYRSYGAPDNGFESWSQAWLESSAVQASGKRVFAHVSAGFDSTPWSSLTRLHGEPSQEEFALFLRTAKDFIEANPDETGGWLIIQSWNEWGEGSVCHPTKRDGFAKLETIKKVLSC